VFIRVHSWKDKRAAKPPAAILLPAKKRQYLTDSVVVALTSSYKIVNIRFSSSGRGRQGILWRDVLGKWVLGFRWTVSSCFGHCIRKYGIWVDIFWLL